jgi:membrane protein
MARKTPTERRDGPVPPQPGQGPEPTSPADLGARDWRQTLKRTLKAFQANRGTMSAASLAFYWFLAIFPAMIAVVGFLGLVQASPTFLPAVREGISTLLPGNAADVLIDAIAKAQRGSAGASLFVALLGLAVALWSASSGMVGLQEAMDVAYEVPESRRFVKKRAVALALVLVTGVLGGLACALLVFGDPIGELIRDALPVGDLFLVVWNIVRWVGTLLALTILFACFYYLAPNRENPSWKWVSPGGLLAMLIWILASLAFSFYVSSLGSFGETYGSLAGVIVLLLWLYMTGLAVVLGATLNAELERQGEARRRGSTPGT